MRNRVVKALYGEKQGSIPMNIQLFAEPGPADPPADPAADPVDPPGDNPPAEPLSFDDYLKTEGARSEFDRRVQQATSTAVSNAEDKWRTLADEKATEAEKLSKMTKDERQEYLQKQANQKLLDREAAITKRELKAEAKNTLTEKGLPIELADVLVYSDADACSTSIDAVEKAFQKAVQAGVEERIKGGKTTKAAPEGAGTETGELEKQIMDAMKGPQ